MLLVHDFFLSWASYMGYLLGGHKVVPLKFQGCWRVTEGEEVGWANGM